MAWPMVMEDKLVLSNDFSGDQNSKQETKTVIVGDKIKIVYDDDLILGRGAFSRIFLGKLGDSPVAVKEVEMRHIKGKAKADENALLLMNLDHPNVVKLLHYEDEDDNDFRYGFYK